MQVIPNIQIGKDDEQLRKMDAILENKDKLYEDI